VNANLQAFKDTVQRRWPSILYPDFPTPTPTPTTPSADSATPTPTPSRCLCNIHDPIRSPRLEGLDDGFLADITNTWSISSPPPPPPIMSPPNTEPGFNVNFELEPPLRFQQTFPCLQLQASQAQHIFRATRETPSSSSHPKAKASRQQEALRLAVENGYVSMVRLLIQHGTDVNFRDQDGETVLLLAIGADDAEMVEVLLENHADGNNVCYFLDMLPIALSL
jgi:hypothetical protein